MKNQDIKILLVEDEPDILEILSYNLAAEGYQVFTAKNGAEGVEKARKKHPDLIILDVMMPEMDGIEACEIIRNTEGLAHTLITFLTARSEDYSQVAGFEAGAECARRNPISSSRAGSSLCRRNRSSTCLVPPVKKPMYPPTETKGETALGNKSQRSIKGS